MGRLQHISEIATMFKISTIFFIGFHNATILLVGWLSNKRMRISVEIGIIVGAVVTVFAVRYLLYGKIMQSNPSDEVEFFSWVGMVLFIGSYTVYRAASSRRKTRKQGIVLYKTITFAIVSANLLILVDATYLYFVQEPTAWVIKIERDTVYLASATIIGLATFGSLVTVRAIGKPETRESRKWGLILMYGGVLVVISYHSFFMYNACCGGINVMQFGGLFVTTVVALISIAFGSVLFLDVGLNDESPSTLED